MGRTAQRRSSRDWTRHDERSIANGVNSGRAQRHVGRDYSFSSGTSALAINTPQPTIRHIWSVGTYLTVYEDGEKKAACIAAWGMNPYVKEVYVWIDGEKRCMELTTLEAMTRPPQPDVNVPLLCAVNAGSYGWWQVTAVVKTIAPRIIYASAPNAMGTVA